MKLFVTSILLTASLLSNSTSVNAQTRSQMSRLRNYCINLDKKEQRLSRMTVLAREISDSYKESNNHEAAEYYFGQSIKHTIKRDELHSEFQSRCAIFIVK